MKKVTVALQGFSERAASILMLFLSRRSKGVYTLVEGNGALNILDLDCVNSNQLWESYGSPEGKLPSIVVSVHEKNLPNAIWLQKPLDLERLTSVIDQIVAEHQLQQAELEAQKQQEQSASQAEQSSEAIRKVLEQEAKPRAKVDLSGQRVYISKSLQGYSKEFSGINTEASTADFYEDRRSLQWFYGTREDEAYLADLKSPELFYDANQYLQGAYIKAVALAKNSDQIIQLNGGGVHLFLTDKGTRVYSETKDSLLHKISFIRATSQQTFTTAPLVDVDLFEQEREQLSVRSTDSLLWNLSLWSARGRLPEGVSGDKVVALTRWPNFTRLDIPPYAMKIVALWFNNPTSINETVAKLDVPYRAVYSVFSACYALGLIKQLSSNEQEQAAAVSSASKPKKVSLPKRLFRALFNKLN